MIREGISGEKTNEALSRIERDVIAKKPDYVTIMYGTNDSYIDVYLDKSNRSPKISREEYKKNLLKMVRILKEHKIVPILMTPIPLGKFQGRNIGIYGENNTNFMLKEYVRVVRQIAAQKHILLVDNFKEWMNWKERGKDIDSWLTDGVHPNPKGHRLIAAAIFRTIINNF